MKEKTAIVLFAAAVASVAFAKDVVDYVDPLIGTGTKRADEANAGGMMPYTGVPFGMWQWVPMTRLSEHGITSYTANDTMFRGFVATRQPAPWMGDYGQISIAAQCCDAPVCDYERRGVAMVKEKCAYAPHRAKVETADGIVGEVASSSRAAILRFTFPKGAKSRRLVIDASRFFLSCFAIDRPQPGGIRFAADGMSAETWNSDRCDSLETPELKNFFARCRIEFSEKAVATGTYKGGFRRGPRRRPGAKIEWGDYPEISQTSGAREVEADMCGGWCDFGPGDEPIEVRIGCSFIDAAQAKDNLEREAGGGLEALAARSRAAWKEQLARIEIDAPEDVRTIFYTAMYHACLLPREIGEYGRYYSGILDKVVEGDSYTDFSLWDTYRTEHAFLAFAASERVDPMMRSLLQVYDQGGSLPKFPSLSYTSQMEADSAEVVLAEAYAKGFRGFDAEKAWEACWKSATVPQINDITHHWKERHPWRGYPAMRCGLTRYMENGWVAADECFESVSRTCDFGLDDMATASLGEALGHKKEAAYLRARARNYTNIWNAAENCFWPRHENGIWKKGLNHDDGHGDYTECTPDTSVWQIPYDIEGLKKLLGGREAAVKRLDEYFEKHFFNAGDPPGSMSLHENEPTHHIAYLYNLLGEHDKCAKTVRRILTTTYSTEAWGFEGNDDCGQMSAWYILSALGFYPTLPYTGRYEIGSPLVKSAKICIGEPYAPATLEVRVKNYAPGRWRVAKVSFNGRDLAERRISHLDLIKGGVLEFEMDAAADKDFRGDGLN